jgi:hypothetical protein
MALFISYYKGSNKVLIYLSNFADKSHSSTVSFNAAELGLTGKLAAKDAERGSSIVITSSTFPITVPGRDFRIVEIRGI